MRKINYLHILGFAILYVVTVFATAFLGYLSPFAWVFFPVIAALLGSFSYFLLAMRWKMFGVSTLLSFLLAVFLLITGECDAPKASLILLAGVAADMIRLFFEQNAQKAMSLAYPIQAIGVIAWILPLWTRTEWYYQGATEELGVDYAQGLMTFANAGGLLLVIALTTIAGFVGILYAAKIIKS